ncbi:MAG: hypothetical protein ABFD69_14710 [Candidatus Sumerlaeia bacterium]
MMKKTPASVASRTKMFVLGIGLGVICGGVLGFYCGFHALYHSIQLRRIEKNFGKVAPGMTSGEAVKTVFEDVLIFPQKDLENTSQEKWAVWGYDSSMMIRARKTGSSPFTLTIDKKTGKVIKAAREYNTRFD